MKRLSGIVCLIALLPAARLAAGQDATPAKSAPELHGQWKGALRVGTQQLRLVLEVPAGPDETSVLVSVDQGGARLAIDELTLDGDKVEFRVAAIGGSYRGTLSRGPDRIEGDWTQGGLTLPLVLTRSAE